MSDLDPNLGALETQLFDIPAPKFIQLVAMLEAQLEKTSDPLSVLMILSKVRPRMVMLRPSRRPSLKRLFCRPFEDLLYSTKSKENVLGKLPRSAIEPIWRLLNQDGDRELLSELTVELTSAGADANQASATGISLWHHAAEILRTTVDRSKTNKGSAKELIQRLRGEHIFLALQDVVEMLEMAEEVETLHALLPPKPIQTLDRAAIDALKGAIERVSPSSSRKPELLLFVVMARMEKPWEISEVIDKIGDGKADKQISALAAAALVANTEEQLVSIREQTTEQTEKDPESLARHVATCIRGLEGAKGVVKSTGNLGLDKQLERARRTLGEMVRINIIDGADQQILHNVMSSDAKKLIPGGAKFWEKQPSEEHLVAAEKHAIALRLCAKFADELGLAGQVDLKLEELRDSMEERAAELLKHVKSGSLAAGQRATAEANLYCTVRLLELIAGADRADQLRHQGLDALYGG